MRPTCERPTMPKRSNSSNVPVALAKARRSLSRSTPSGRFISKIGESPNCTVQEGRRTGMVTDTARARATSGRYAKLLPRVSCLSRRPASAPSVQTLIIIILFQEFIEGRPSRACFLQFQLKPKGGKNIGNLGISQFAQSPVLQRIERRETNLGFLCKCRLRQT